MHTGDVIKCLKKKDIIRRLVKRNFIAQNRRILKKKRRKRRKLETFGYKTSRCERRVRVERMKIFLNTTRELPNFSRARSNWQGHVIFFSFAMDCLMKLVERTGPAGVVGSRSRVSSAVNDVDGQRERLHEQRPFLFLLLLSPPSSSSSSSPSSFSFSSRCALRAHRLRHFSLENACKSSPLLCTYAMIIAEIRPGRGPDAPWERELVKSNDTLNGEGPRLAIRNLRLFAGEHGQRAEVKTSGDRLPDESLSGTNFPTRDTLVSAASSIDRGISPRVSSGTLSASPDYRNRVSSDHAVFTREFARNSDGLLLQRWM